MTNIMYIQVHMFKHLKISVFFSVFYYSMIRGVISAICRSSHSEVFCEKGVLRNFAKFTGKHLCHSLFFNKVTGLRPATLSKKRLWHRCFPVNFAKFLWTLFFIKHLWWLLLNLSKLSIIRGIKVSSIRAYSLGNCRKIPYKVLHQQNL